MLEELEKYAKENHVPIMMKDGIDFLLAYLKKQNYKTVLEIGTAIGYSAIRMAKISKDIKVVTLERDLKMYNEALKNIEKFGLTDQIKVIFTDALDIEIKDKFDLIFIDAAKAQYIKFFEKYKDNLNPGGTIVSDNLNFHGLTSDSNIQSRSLRQLVRKINAYVDFLKNNEEFTTTFYNTGDGISLSVKNSK